MSNVVPPPPHARWRNISRFNASAVSCGVLMKRTCAAEWSGLTWCHSGCIARCARNCVRMPYAWHRLTKSMAIRVADMWWCLIFSLPLYHHTTQRNVGALLSSVFTSFSHHCCLCWQLCCAHSLSSWSGWSSRCARSCRGGGMRVPRSSRSSSGTVIAIISASASASASSLR